MNEWTLSSGPFSMNLRTFPMGKHIFSVLAHKIRDVATERSSPFANAEYFAASSKATQFHSGAEACGVVQGSEST